MSNEQLESGSEKLQDNLRGWRYRFVLFAVIAVGFGLRLHTLDSESLWYDELLQLDIAQGPPALIFPRLRGHTAVPLDYLIAHFWMMLGRSDGWVRLPAVLVGTLTLPVSYLLGRVLVGRAAGLLLMFLLAISPFHVHYSQEVRPYALIVLGVTLTVYGLWQLNQTGRWRYILPLQVGVLVALLSHIFAIAVFVPLVIFLAGDFLFGRKKQQVVKTFGLLCLTSLLPLFVLLLTGWGNVLYYTTRGVGQAVVGIESVPVERAVSLDAGAVPDPIHGPTVTWPFIEGQILAPFAASDSPLPLLLFSLLTVLGGVFIFRQKKKGQGFLLLLWLVLPPLIVVPFLIFRDTFFASRYIISILPAYLLLLAAGILAIPYWLRRVSRPWLSAGVFLILAGLIIANFGVGLNIYYQTLHKENWHLVTDFVIANANSDDAVVAFHAEPAINWYYPPAWAAPNFYEDLEAVQLAVAESPRGWVVLSIFSADYDAQVRAWLSEQQAVRLVLDPLIHVYYVGNNVSPDQLLEEIQGFALPVNHALYASLARENRRRPDVARQYYQLAIEYAPNSETRAEYEAALELLPR